MFRPVVIMALCLMAAFCAAAWFTAPRGIFYAELVATLALAVLAVPTIIGTRNELHRFMNYMGEQLSVTQKRSLTQFPLPVVVTDEKGEILWYNDLFRSGVIGGGESFGDNIGNIASPVDRLKATSDAGAEVTCRDRVYNVYAVESNIPEELLVTYYFIDKTGERRLEKAYNETRPAVMTIVLDNIEDLLAGSRESERSRIMGEVERIFEDFGADNRCFIKKVSSSRFVAVIEERYLAGIISERFRILDEARSITTAEGQPVTLSVGVGRGDYTLTVLDSMSAQALEMCLGRGGDQAAVKDAAGYEFFGGFSKAIEKRTKVKTRLVAAAMSELIASSHNVLIMGHRYGDMDCAGAAIGMAAACKYMEKPVAIVVDRKTTLAGPSIDRVEADGNRGLFLSPEQAAMLVEPETLLIIVDTHVKHILESPEIFNECKNIVVIDHHRRMVGYIENAVIFYHEPNASSASEMVTELIQYFGDRCRPSKTEAEALLAGITLDTKSFAVRAGVRTFEAAAWLRRVGADTVEVKKLFADSLETYQHRAAVVSRADVYRGCAVSFSEKYDDIAIVAPQAADELLTIQGVKASFVLFQAGDGVSCSARSLGAVNVQVIMEALGGGGHLTMAGAQMKGMEPAAAHAALLKAIDDYFENTEGHTADAGPTYGTE